MTAGEIAQPKTFEWWMLSMYTIGISYSAFVSLLIPPYVTETGGDASTHRSRDGNHRTRRPCRTANRLVR